MFILPSLKSLVLNPIPFLVWLNILRYKISTFSPKKLVKHGPLSLVIYVTKRCNFSCDFCFTYDDLNKSNWQYDELTLTSFHKLLDSSFGKKALRIGFLGGEPFLNPLLFDFVKLATQKGKITTIVTNASLVDETQKQKLLENPPTMLGISLYNNNEEKVIELCNWLNKNKLNYWVQTVIDANSIYTMKKLLNFAHGNKIKNFIFSNYHPSLSNKISLTIFDDNEKFFNEATEVRKLAKKLNITIILPQPIQRKIIKKNCKMAFSYIHVDAKGSIGPCCFRAPNEKFGNIFDANPWNNVEVQKIRTPFLIEKDEVLGECKYCENLSRDLYGL